MKSATAALHTWAEMVKLSHSVFALPFALIATFVVVRQLDGRSWPYVGQIALILVCMVSARSTAMTFNRIVDAEIDARNPRTAGRPLPAGRLAMPAAWMMLVLSMVTFGIGCMGFFLLYGNTWPILLAGPVLAYLCGYSFAKRFTRWSHYWLGSAIALAPVAAWIAIDPASLGIAAVILMITVTCWIAGFDIIYACQDIEVDRQEGLHSLPSRWGPRPALWLARFSHAVVVAGLVALGVVEGLGVVYAVGVLLVAGLLAVENALVRPGDYRHVNLAFFALNGVVSVVLAVALAVDLAVRG